MTPETSLKKAIKDYLNLKKIFHWHNLQGLGSYPGTPDIFALHDGVLWAIEVKTESKRSRLSDHQAVFLEKVELHGGKALVARSLNDVMREIK